MIRILRNAFEIIRVAKHDRYSFETIATVLNELDQEIQKLEAQEKAKKEEDGS